MRTLAISSILVVLAACAQPAPPATSAAAPATANKRELICRTVKSGASRMGSNECHTQEEWDGQSARLRGTGAPASSKQDAKSR